MLRALPVPQLFIFGSKDEYINCDTAAALTSGHPQAKVVVLENSGHMGFVEETQRAAEELIGFIEQE